MLFNKSRRLKPPFAFIPPLVKGPRKGYRILSLKKEEGRGKKWMGNQTLTNCQHRVDGGVLKPN
ncbi:MAG: hypothetical protein F6K24_18235 [Okeania sp. SIO2D1]|nr:hypothetical protein [Okeania sp. SIO2D1]